jgi:hypothetical protein
LSAQSNYGAQGAKQTMKRTKAGKQKPTPPGTVIDRRGVTLSAGVAAFDAALVKRFKDFAKGPTDAEQINSEAFGEDGPLVGPAAVVLPHLYQAGDDDDNLM